MTAYKIIEEEKELFSWGGWRHFYTAIGRGPLARGRFPQARKAAANHC
jgi:hypothetical protein